MWIFLFAAPIVLHITWTGKSVTAYIVSTPQVPPNQAKIPYGMLAKFVLVVVIPTHVVPLPSLVVSHCEVKP